MLAGRKEQRIGREVASVGLEDAVGVAARRDAAFERRPGLLSHILHDRIEAVPRNAEGEIGQARGRALLAVEDPHFGNRMCFESGDAQPVEPVERLPAQEPATQRVTGFARTLDEVRRRATPRQRNRRRAAGRARAQD